MASGSPTLAVSKHFHKEPW